MGAWQQNPYLTRINKSFTLKLEDNTLSLTKDIANGVWLVLVTGTSHVLYYSVSRSQCERFMGNVGR
jgi:hypothetical protein